MAPSAGDTPDGGSNSTGKPGGRSRVATMNHAPRATAATAATIDQSTVWSAGSGAGGGSAPSGNVARTVTGVYGSSGPVRTVSVRSDASARHGVSLPCTHSTRVTSAGRCTVAVTDSIDICQPVPTTFHHQRTVPPGPRSRVSVVVEVIT